MVFFQNAEALENFKLGHLKLDAQASAVALTARASADLAYRSGVAIVTMAKGGLMYEASVGGQKFSFRPIGSWVFARNCWHHGCLRLTWSPGPLHASGGYPDVNFGLTRPRQPAANCRMPPNPRPATGTEPLGGVVLEPIGSPRGRWPAATVTFLTALYALGYLVWERGTWGSAELRDLIGTVAFMPLNVAIVILNALASRSPVLDPGVRRALRLLAIGGAMVFIGNTISVIYLIALHDNPTVSWADPFYLADSLFTLAALLAFPLARRTRLERWKFVLDAAMVLVGGGVAIWYFSVRPTAAAEDNGVVVTALAYAYPSPACSWCSASPPSCLRRPVDGNRLAFGLLVGGVLVSIIADLTFTFVTLMVGGRTTGWTDAVYLLCYLMLIGSAERYYRRPVAISARPGRRGSGSR